MRILHLIKTGEGAMWAYRQIKVLSSLGDDIAVCLPWGPIADKYINDGIKIYEFDFSINVLKGRKQFQNILDEFKPDIIHSHFVVTTIFVRIFRLLNRLKIPVIFQVPGPLHLEHFLFRNAELLLRSKQDYWVASCKWTRQRYLEYGIPGNHVFLSYYGTDLTFIRNHDKGKLRQLLKLEDEDFIVAMVAYMYAPKKYLGQKKGLKGHEDFLEAMGMLLKKNKRIKVVVIGGAWNGAVEYEKHLMEMGKALCGDNVHFLGSRSDVPELYADVNLVVHPSYSENLGGAAESLLLGVPTISTNVGGFPDIVIDKETGYLVNPGSPAEIADTVETAFNNYEKAEEMALTGKEKARAVLNVEITGREIHDIYRNVLSNEAVAL